MKKDKINAEVQCRLGSVGGQAVLEGVMMKSRSRVSLAVRNIDGKIVVKNSSFTSIAQKYKIFKIPVLRGIINFFEMMKLNFATLTASAEMLGLTEEEEETKFEKWLREKCGKSLFDIIMAISMVLGLALGFGIFFFLPIFITKTVDTAVGGMGWIKNLVEGLIKIAIFILYLWLVSFMKDIRRTFEYHGAEHKSIFCYESGEELTPENVKKHKRFHPRCGTSFMFVMLFLSILIFSLPFVTWDNMFLRMVTKILLLPLIVGIGYEFIRFAGRHDNIVIRILSAPGLWVQRITTREPDLEQIEVAITALKCALPEEFPDFVAEEYKGQEKDSEDAESAQTDEAEASESTSFSDALNTDESDAAAEEEDEK